MINRHELQRLAKQFRSGQLSLNDFTDAVFAAGTDNEEVAAFDQQQIDLRLPVRPENSHKGDFGKVLLVGGSLEMPGAIALAAKAALRSGAGMTAIMSPKEIWKVVAGYCPCTMTAPVESAFGQFVPACIEQVMKKVTWADVVVVGPGMGRSKGCQELLQKLYCQVQCPVIVDADGLNNLADGKIDLSDHAGPRILTPHEGEFARLVGSVASDRGELEESAVRLARERQIVVLLKGPRTMVTDGDRQYHNRTGNAGMATAGSGDVLSGIIAALVGQKMDVFEAAEVGSHLHGLAGDQFAERSDSASMLATDLIDELPLAMSEMRGVGQN